MEDVCRSDDSRLDAIVDKCYPLADYVLQESANELSVEQVTITKIQKVLDFL